MTIFLRLTDADGNAILINVDHVIAVEKNQGIYRGTSRVTTTRGSHIVAETVDEVMERMSTMASA